MLALWHNEPKRIRTRVIWLLLASLLFPTWTQPIADSPSSTLDLNIGRLVAAPAKPRPPDYIAIKQANDARVAAQEAARKAAQLAEVQRQAQAVKAAQIVPMRVTGTCTEWITAAGITDVVNAVTLINMESGCDPYAVNPYSGACNVAQELPCGKSGCVLGDGACSVAWMKVYVLERYGSWANAVAFHLRMNWY